MAKESKEKETDVGITVKKDEDLSEWYTQVITKAELIDYSDVSGCYVLRPRAYALWETVQGFMDKKFKEQGVKNAYFPLFIPESYLNKEQDHVEGFTPEVAWVTHSGESKLKERLAVRPTSETIMYAHYSRWVRSWKDLPMRINQWCNVVRWEFKNPIPFMRSREFLWQEGHNVLATKEEMDKDVMTFLDIYAQTYEELYAIPAMKGMKSEKEKFAGADYTTSVETFMPVGKAAQACTSHGLGQNFAKAFDINFIDNDGKKQYVWQDSWGFSTRSLGILIMYHGDDKGLVIPPRLAVEKAVIIPILFEKTKDQVLKEAKNIEKELEDFNVFIDDREEKSPGWKYSEWELKGIPIRIEMGPKDIEKGQAIVVRRDNFKKEPVKLSDLKKKVPEMLETMQKDLLENAKKFVKENTVDTESWDDVVKAIKDKKMVKTTWCKGAECEELIKDETGGAKILNMPFDQPDLKGKKCSHCGKEAKAIVYVAKSY